MQVLKARIALHVVKKGLRSFSFPHCENWRNSLACSSRGRSGLIFMAQKKRAKNHHKGAQQQECSSSQHDTQLPAPENAILIDGSILEGGGQILRNSAALSVIMRTPICVEKIRAGRSKPGLRPQHLAGLRLLENLSGGKLSGGAESSNSIVLEPAALQCGNFEGNTGTAGSCTLLAQAALPCLLFASPTGAQDMSVVGLRGGTDASMAPPVGYMQHILLPTLRRLFDVDVTEKLERRGFFPKGGGHITLEVRCLPIGAKLPAFDLTSSSDVTSVKVLAFSAGKLNGSQGGKPSIVDRLASSAVEVLRQNLGRDIEISTEFTEETEQSAFGDGVGMLLIATTSGGCLLGAAAIGERGKSSEQLGKAAAQELIDDINAGGCVDCWLQDQLIIFMALADGESSMTCGEPTLHTRTAMVIAEQMTSAKFTVRRPAPRSQEPWTISCKGAGIAAGGHSSDL